MTATITILLADDHAILRETLRESLTVEPDFTVVADVGDGARTVAVAGELQPDVVLLDIDMPGIPAALAVQRLREVAPRTRVIILSMYDSPDFVREMVKLGVRGYLSKGVSRQHLVSVIRSVAGEGQAVLMAVASPGPAPAAAGPAPLSDRERDLLELVSQAMSNRQVAASLGITEATVKRHLHNIFTKLGAVSRIDAVNKATDLGLIGSAPALRHATPRLR